MVPKVLLRKFPYPNFVQPTHPCDEFNNAAKEFTISNAVLVDNLCLI